MVWRGGALARNVGAWQGTARHGWRCIRYQLERATRQGRARLGKVRLGRACLGAAR
jgi:hypothetical protein